MRAVAVLAHLLLLSSLFFSLVFSAPSCTQGSPASCCFAAPSGRFYDLTKAYSQHTGDYVAPKNADGKQFYLSVCHLATHCTDAKKQSYPFCYVDTDGTVYGLGLLTTRANTEQGNGEGFEMALSGGTDGKKGTVLFTCNSQVSPGSIPGAAIEAGDSWTMVFYSEYACPVAPAPPGPATTTTGGPPPPTSGGTTGTPHGGKSSFDMGWLFPICLFSALALYCIVGFSIQKWGREKEGTDTIPNYEFWIELPGLAWDGVKFIYRKISGHHEYQQF